MATLINGNLNNPVYASQDADLLAAICGNKTVVTPVGSQFAEELEDANTIKVDDGVIITKEGRRIQLDNGDIDEFLIPTGTQGQTNYYICGYHLYTDEESAELCETFVEPVSSATDTIDEDTFRDGATEVYVSLLRVKQEGVNITSITRLLPSGTDMNQINVGLSDGVAAKVNISDIINNLTSTSTNKPLSANQGKVLDEKISNLPVKANDKHFYNANGLEVVNANATAFTDLICRNVSVSGSYVKTSASAINVTNSAGNAWLPLNASDLKINGSKSVNDSLPKTYSFSNISLTADGIGYLDYNVLRPSTHIVTSAFGTVASPGGLCRFEVLADMTNDIYAIQPWTYKDVKVTSTTANVTIGYFKR